MFFLSEEFRVILMIFTYCTLTLPGVNKQHQFLFCLPLGFMAFLGDAFHLTIMDSSAFAANICIPLGSWQSSMMSLGFTQSLDVDESQIYICSSTLFFRLYNF